MFNRIPFYMNAMCIILRLILCSVKMTWWWSIDRN